MAASVKLRVLLVGVLKIRASHFGVDIGPLIFANYNIQGTIYVSGFGFFVHTSSLIHACQAPV